jgi:hypothetical protein
MEATDSRRLGGSACCCQGAQMTGDGRSAHAPTTRNGSYAPDLSAEELQTVRVCSRPEWLRNAHVRLPGHDEFGFQRISFLGPDASFARSSVLLIPRASKSPFTTRDASTWSTRSRGRPSGSWSRSASCLSQWGSSSFQLTSCTKCATAAGFRRCCCRLSRWGRTDGPKPLSSRDIAPSDIAPDAAGNHPE